MALDARKRQQKLAKKAAKLDRLKAVLRRRQSSFHVFVHHSVANALDDDVGLHHRIAESKPVLSLLSATNQDRAALQGDKFS